MGKRYTKKNLGDPNWSKPNNYKIKQNDAIYDVEIVPNKGVKGDASAQPFNDQNAEDIENALVSLDDDLAFIEADYVTEAEHALKQNITDNGLNTTNKTIVGAINEVKSDSEYHDLLQDDAIAIVNNKINALPMNGSLKNIRTSLVGIPTTFTNIDMFNTKQTVTNYQPLSLDYKGAAEPHIILMKTIGDYTFDFAIEATHTNGTDTTIILEAWVDGVLYDTATRTLVGGSNQINGVTGFFTYSKGTDTVPSEIYFRFRASQGNTSANKALINTNLLGNSSENSFTDTDHVTGTNLNEPSYNGQTTTFIINDIKGDLNTLEDTVVKSVDGVTPDELGNVNAKHRVVSLVDLGILDADFTPLSGRDIFGHIHQEAITYIGTDKPITVRQRLDDVNSFPILHGKLVDEALVNTGSQMNSIVVFEYEINVDGFNNNSFVGNHNRFKVTSGVKYGTDFKGSVDADQVYYWEGTNEVNVNGIELIMGVELGQNIYLSNPLVNKEQIHVVGWADALVRISQVNGGNFPNDVIKSASRQLMDGTSPAFYTSTVGIDMDFNIFMDNWHTFESIIYCGFSGKLCIKGSSQAEIVANTYQNVTHSSRSSKAYEGLSSFRILTGEGTYGVVGSFNLMTSRRIKVSYTPFTLLQLMQTNETEEIAHTVYNNQFVSEAQKTEFEANGTSPLFYTLGDV